MQTSVLYLDLFIICFDGFNRYQIGSFQTYVYHLLYEKSEMNYHFFLLVLLFEILLQLFTFCFALWDCRIIEWK